MQSVRTADGVRIEYQVFGAGKTGVLFQHGWGNATRFWDHLFREHLLNIDGLSMRDDKLSRAWRVRRSRARLHL
jgi:pimeloyl-ACP methyl ester carboxylesterase